MPRSDQEEPLMNDDPTLDAGIATTATFDRIVQGMYGESVATTEEERELDPSWYSTD
jgi:hypothetical protein